MKAAASALASHSGVAARLENAQGADRASDRGDHMAGAVRRELLRCRALQMHVVALAAAERLLHEIRAAGVDRLDRRIVDAGAVAGVAEHRHGLAAMVHEHSLAGEVPPGEPGLRGAARRERTRRCR